MDVHQLGQLFLVEFLRDHSLDHYFLVCIAIPSLVNSPIFLFADDTKIYRAIQCRKDHLQLQSDIDKLLEWSNMWQLKFNILSVLRLGKPHSYGDYKLDCVAISQSN